MTLSWPHDLSIITRYGITGTEVWWLQCKMEGREYEYKNFDVTVQEGDRYHGAGDVTIDDVRYKILYYVPAFYNPKVSNEFYKTEEDWTIPLIKQCPRVYAIQKYKRPVNVNILA